MIDVLYFTSCSRRRIQIFLESEWHTPEHRTFLFVVSINDPNTYSLLGCQVARFLIRIFRIALRNLSTRLEHWILVVPKHLRSRQDGFVVNTNTPMDIQIVSIVFCIGPSRRQDAYTVSTLLCLVLLHLRHQE